ncbi:MAG TPA: enolase C-terminal domain-like protein [bacterium]|nr:enolase C-terminal domain-like protein [bacterium]
MRIEDVRVIRFRYTSRVVRDAEGHGHPGPAHEAVQTLTVVQAESGIDGYCFGGSEALAAAARPILVGQHPLDRERIWQTLRRHQRLAGDVLTDRGIAVLDVALWDLAGRLAHVPISRLLGGFRTRVPAYASTMCGDDLPGGLNSPEAYAEFAVGLVERGYPAIKLHTWMPPLGPDPKRDVAACRAVRDRVGPGVRLMLDCFHDYSRTEALYIGRALEELDFYWFEEPMDEHNVSSYVWLADQLRIPLVGPETAEGKMFTRAEWILRGASDISRYSANLGGITPMLKAIHLCESLGVPLEVHGGGAANLQVLGAMGFPGEYYERGLLHPFLDYETATPWLTEVIDPLDHDGSVRISEKPGLGQDIDWEYIEQHRLDA